MTEVTRRTIVAGMAVAAAAIPAAANAQSTQKPPAPQPQTAPPANQPTFGFEDVIKRAREVSAAPYDASVTPLPEQLTKLDFDAWREIRFRSDRSMLGATGGRFRLQLFHLGHLFLRPVTINTIRDGVATPIPYTANLFDYGRAKFDKPLPVNLWLRRLPGPLPAQRPARQRRDPVLHRRQLFPLAGPRPEIRPLCPRAQYRHRPPRQ